jgi:glucose/arabinose dehydrogenase
MRRGLVGLGGIAASVLPLAGRSVATAASNHGAVVTPNPIKPRVAKSGLAVELLDFAAPPTSAKSPRAALNFLYHAGDGSGRLLTNDTRGVIWELDPKTGAARFFLDLRPILRGRLVVTARATGLRSFAFHPDFARKGAPGRGKLYTATTETVASRPKGVRLFAGAHPAVLHDVVAEWSVDAANPDRVDPGSRRELFRIDQLAPAHTADQLMFDPNARPGDAAYGMLWLGVGDGGDFDHPDPYNLAQNPGVAPGKLLRVDPLRRGSQAYTVPSDNPFVGRAGYLPEIWALGLRHPQNLSFDRGGSGRMILTDIGKNNVEEVNLGIPGANHGWPLREGTFVTNRTNPNVLYALPADDARYGFTYPVAEYDHDEGRAIAGGFVYRGAAVPALAGQYLFGDIVNGRVFHVPEQELRFGRLATIHELTLLRQGRPVRLLDHVHGQPGRVDLRFGQGEDGEVYILTKQDGMVRKLRPA